MRDHEFIAMLSKSTIGRSYDMPRAWKVMRPGLQTLSVISPRLASRLAARVVLRPPRAPRPESFPYPERSAIVHGAGGEIRTKSWGRGPSVLLLHGWGGCSQGLAHVIEPLVRRGLSAIAIETPRDGEGLSYLPAFVAAIGVFDRELGPVRGVIAHGSGAVTATRAISNGLRPEAAVFVAPPTDLVRVPVEHARRLGFSRRVVDLMQQRIEQRIPWSGLDIVRMAPSFEVPLLVLHDREDPEVPWQDGAVIARAWPGAELLATQGLGHHGILGEPAIATRAVEFICSRITGGNKAYDGENQDRRSLRLPHRPHPDRRSVAMTP